MSKEMDMSKEGSHEDSYEHDDMPDEHSHEEREPESMSIALRKRQVAEIVLSKFFMKHRAIPHSMEDSMEDSMENDVME